MPKPALLNDSSHGSHATPAQSTRRTLSVCPVAAFRDNYVWLIHDGDRAVAVDPGEAAPVLAALRQHKLTLAAILLTHHHADHVGGVPVLLQHTKVPVYGPHNPAIGTVTHPVREGDVVTLHAPALTLRVLEIPGHTADHIAYIAPANTVTGTYQLSAAAEAAHTATGADTATGPDAAPAPWLFCGDTLFAAGCGRLFEGTPAQMMASLGKLEALPAATAVYCAHEYTLSNLRFATAVEPGNRALQARCIAEQEKRDAGLPTLPSSIGLERQTNPFLRYAETDVIASLRQAGRLPDGGAASPLAAFTALREWKNAF